MPINILCAIIVISLLGISHAKATDVRSVDMTYVLLDGDGKPAKDPFEQTKDDPDCVHCPPLTLGRVAMHALFGSYQDEKDLSGDRKWARGALAMRIRDSKAADLTAEEITELKKLIGKLYGPVIVMQAIPLIDPAAKAPELK